MYNPSQNLLFTFNFINIDHNFPQKIIPIRKVFFVMKIENIGRFVNLSIPLVQLLYLFIINES